MKHIFEIDKNFRVMACAGREDAVFYDPRREPFRICGVFYENGMFRRMPEKVAKTVSEGVYYLHTNTAGGRVRFRTDSPYILIEARMSGVDHMNHFPLVGSAGFDLYVENEYEASFLPPQGMKDGYGSAVDLGAREMRDVTIHMPLYANVLSLGIGLAADAAVLPGSEHRDIPPIVYYGSSITQGGCASRPGNAYQNILSRRLDIDHINLGFSGNAKGEPEMRAYLAGLEMSAFVLDYDHNAPTAEHLQKTHEPLFLAVREAHPDLPVLMMSRPKFRLTEDEKKRREIVLATVENAVKRGDNNVSFLDGPALMAAAGNEGTVDNCHPNDLGFYSMAKAVETALRGLLGERSSEFGDV